MQPTGLAFCENAYNIEVSPRGKSTSLRIYPAVPGLTLYNYVSVNPGIKKSYLYVTGAPYMNDRVVLGEVNGPFTGFSQVPDPALFCAYTLLNRLKRAGIGIRDSCTTVYRQKLLNKYKRTERKTFYTHYSPALAQLVYHTNQVSQNFYAETFLRMIALVDGNYGSTSGGTGAVIKYFKEQGVNMHGFYMADGSGVSRYDAVTPRFLCDMLCTYARDKKIFSYFYQSLPISGESGTLRRLGTDSVTLGKVHAKGGYMSRVSSLAGYVTAKNGMMYAFSIMFNNQEWDNEATRKKLEHLMLLMARLN
jgi:D-alanyl-D-alanine carboxypeptidase/D-alanyl-D-alanine-endopeptidase (penicillin-binding protein 4)